ncbi:histidinol-phosphatase [Sphaerochaeta pleomorpha str. Grapes]|uniref:Histidine biosynthesis bifunctional protein HisB n=1 Tax=Sphaerochaeta pleomorpha (strain ATCC BAA-1885 / DSM 22778 / Grapes) TaxID=158190 RepID=G8QTT8_SPHPG|nr:bifunctional histidinol-phosphatase/imidazoleglycerol-phosphate dehydratase HisB [Sphaerochaeta pleomorpha]AEV29114.1 histidinol-phosphatase [Sphaerochaeta pleomorpha str. Grapes]
MENKQYKPVLFLDRDGIIVIEDQIDSLEKVIFIPGVFNALARLRKESDFYFAMVSNQDGVGTPSFPQEAFSIPHARIMETLQGEGIDFDAVHVDLSLPSDNCPGRKPKIGMLGEYLSGEYDLEHSVMIGDRLTDVELAHNLGCKAVWFANPERETELDEGRAKELNLRESCILISDDWPTVAGFLLGDKKLMSRTATVVRKTKETAIELSVNLDGTGRGQVSTGIAFFDHMLDQIVRHTGFDIHLHAHGDLIVDEHHTVEDVGLALGQAVREALADKRGISRYGFEILPMDEVLSQVALDFSGRPYFVWDVSFKREYVGTFPTEMVEHFFKSFCDESKCNLNMKVSEGNTHHQVEALFKAFARAMKKAVHRYPWSDSLPSTKGVL